VGTIERGNPAATLQEGKFIEWPSPCTKEKFSSRVHDQRKKIALGEGGGGKKPPGDCPLHRKMIYCAVAMEDARGRSAAGFSESGVELPEKNHKKTLPGTKCLRRTYRSACSRPEGVWKAVTNKKSDQRARRGGIEGVSQRTGRETKT